jgi:hypothetical protein
MILHGGADGGLHEHRRSTRARRLASGTLACPRCDAPVVLGAPVAVGDWIGCPYCLHTGAVRDFLSLAAPTRPARVEVRVVERSAREQRRVPQLPDRRR